MVSNDHFREVRYFRRGNGSKFVAFGGAVVIFTGVVLAPSAALQVLAVAFGLLLWLPLLLAFETTVADGVMLLRVRPLWRKTIDLADVESVELTVADNQVELFGGWSAREDGASAYVASVEGTDRSVGNRAVVLHLRSQAQPQQVGTFQPRRLLQIIEAQR